MDHPCDYDKLAAECEEVRRALINASQNGHLDPINMTEKDEKKITEAVQNLSYFCSKVIVSRHSMKKTRQDLFA